jgi:hypothetical protein
MWQGHGGITMSSKTVGKASQSGGVFYSTYQKLLKQRGQIDRQLNKVQSQIMKQLSKEVSGRTVYVPRVKSNKVILIEAIHRCMPKKKEMTMDEILTAMTKKGIYKTESTYLYTMVNNKLNRDPHIKKVSRGVFVYNPPKNKSVAGAA